MSGRPEFRKSQGVVPFGVGAIVDFPDDSLMTAGLDVWPQVSPSKTAEVRAQLRDATQIIDGRLQKRLSAQFGRPIRRFLSPPEAPEQSFGFAKQAPDNTKAYLPFVRFPRWHFCPRCRTLWELAWNAPIGDYNEQLRCASKTRLKRGEARVCAELPKQRRPRLIPVRFAVACPAGHITDFPWQQWCHLHSDAECLAGSGELFLVSTGAAGLAGIQVICSRCDAKNTMSSAFSESAFKRIWNGRCTGERPWLGPDATQPNCDYSPTTIQRGAANAYFAKTETSILIPPYSRLLRQVLDRPDLWSDIKSLPLVNGELPRQWLIQKAESLGLDPDTFVQAVQEKMGAEEDELSSKVSDQEYRYAEYKAFHGPRPPHSERKDFDLTHLDIEHYDESFSRYFERVVLIPKLRETRVLTGFTRVMPPEAVDSTAVLSLREQDWFPAIEVRGEGIFLVLRHHRLDAWLEDNSLTLERAEAINRRLRTVAAERGIEARSVTPEFLLIHSLAHALIRQLVFDCGYDSSSLRERIYVDRSLSDGMQGVLIYTASGDSEGTLGGLVRQGQPGRLEPTFNAAIANARLCSSDPLCIESTGQGVNSLNLSACHACLLLPETSCEEGNRLLDRALLIGREEDPSIGLFSEVGVGM